ncbi:T9SS type A sorting domain-containing protein [Salibacter sp.]|uniref:T9SS type A sorting domain-containing protein n=1 Tax=Salibacter sp. TaxID=2010995 RepID=UPI00287065B9|nr:T9SS type A sorting domain-containing protein [Salibacter sp.]
MFNPTIKNMKKLSILLLASLLVSIIPQAQTSQNITFMHEGKTIYGTFTKPSTGSDHPTIIINPGSGANDRDGTIPMVGGNIACLYPNLLNDTLKPYAQLGEALVDSGYAVLRYDKIEYTYGSSLGEVTFEKLWLPVNSAINYLKTRSDVDTNNIVLIGHSEGSSLIPYIAKQRTDVKALISVAGPRTPFDSLLAYQLVHFADTCNGNVMQAQAQASQILQYFYTVRTNSWDSTTQPFAGVPASEWYKYIQITDSVAINYNQADLPTLFLGLERDLNVPNEELTRFENDVTITNDFWMIPNLNHYMTTYTNPAVSRALTDTIIHWLRENVLISAVSPSEKEFQNYQLYPNPFQSEFTIKIDGERENNWAMTVTNIEGEEIMSRELNSDGKTISKKLQLPGLSSGVYFVSLQNEHQQITKRIVKF